MQMLLFIGFFSILFIVIFVLVIIQWAWYGVVSSGYFISDYWLIIIAIFFGLAALGGESTEQKSGFSVIAILFLLLHYGDRLYITDYERDNVIKKAEEISATYNEIGFKSYVKDDTMVICNIRLPFEYVPDIGFILDSFETKNSEALERYLGPKVSSYDLYRAIEL